MPTYSPTQLARSPSPLLPWATSPVGPVRLPPFAALRDFSDAGERERERPARNINPDPRLRKRSDGFIDLTLESSPSNPSFPHLPNAPIRPTVATSSRTMPSRRASDDSEPPSRKRRRIASAHYDPVNEVPPVAPRSSYIADVIDVESSSPEEVDLTSVEDSAGLKRLQEEQRARHKLSTQDRQNRLLQDSLETQVPKNKGPIRLGELTCIICMENMTDMTATHCGHIFCHTCIMEALIAGDNQGDMRTTAKCPMCRTKVNRNQTSKGAPQLIPLSFKVLRKSEKAKGKQREVQ